MPGGGGEGGGGGVLKLRFDWHIILVYSFNLLKYSNFVPFAEAMSILDCSPLNKCINMHTFTASARTCIIRTLPVLLCHMVYWIHTW